MNYRLQDIMKMIIPGLYLMAMILVYEISNSDFGIDISKLKDLSAIVVLLVPFVGFVIGYFVECITAGLEHGWYALGLRRPSKNILRGSSRYPVAEIDKVKMKHQIRSSSITNSSFASSKISISSTNYSAPMKVCKNQRIHIIRYSRA